MGLLRRGGYLFVTWPGDHPPRHVHIYRDKAQIAKYDLESGEVMAGAVSGRLLKIIRSLQKENKL